MEVEHIKRIIADQEDEIAKKFREERIIERELLNEAKKYVTSPNALALLGVRRSGKSILSILLSRGKNFCYVNFDDPELEGFPVKEYRGLLEAVYSLKGDVDIIILDEVHNLKSWELLVNRLRESRVTVVTGSNAKMLSSELADRLTGRYVDLTLFPFSFGEYLSFKDFSPDIYLTRDISKTRDLLSEFLRMGGFPEAYKFGGRYIARIYSDIIEKDVVRRHNIRFVDDLKTLARILVSNYSREVTYNRLKNLVGVRSVHTVKNYVGYLRDAYLLFTLERFSFKLREQVIAPKKVYCIDTGIIDTLSFRSTEDVGRLIENLVAIELLRRSSYSYPGVGIYYWKDHQQREVDFVVKEGLQIKQLIQVCYDISDYGARERELKSLVKASSELKCKNLLVITWDYEGEEEFKNKRIQLIPLWKWLLQNSR